MAFNNKMKKRNVFFSMVGIVIIAFIFSFSILIVILKNDDLIVEGATINETINNVVSYTQTMIAGGSLKKEDYLKHIQTYSGVTYAWSDYKWCKQGNSKLINANENYFSRYFIVEEGNIKNSKVIITRQIEDWKPTYKKENCRIEYGMEMCDYIQNGTYRDWKIIETEFKNNDEVKKYLADLNKGECVTIRNYAERGECPEGGYACPFRVDNVLEANSPIRIRKYKEYAWWNFNAQYGMNITLTESWGKARINETVVFELNVSDASHIQTDCDDVWIVNAPCRFSGSEIPRSIVAGKNIAGYCKIVFDVNASASATTKYCAYFGDSDASAPVYNQYPVYWEDDFEDNNIDDWVGGGLIAWNYATKCSVAGGIVTCASSQGMNTYFGKKTESEGFNITNNHWTVKFSARWGLNDQYGAVGINQDNVTASRGLMLMGGNIAGASQIQSKEATPVTIYSAGGVGYDSPAYRNHTYEWQPNGSMGFLNNSLPVPATTDITNTANTNKGFFRVSFDSYDGNFLIDWIKVASGEIYDNPLTVGNNSEEISNTPPAFYPISDFSKNEDFGTFTLDLSANISDEDDADALLNFTWINTNPSLISIAINNATDVVTFTSGTNLFGVATINLTVWDTAGLQNSTNFSITVNSVNDVPYGYVISYPIDGTTTNDSTPQIEISNGSDIEGDDIYYIIEIFNSSESMESSYLEYLFDNFNDNFFNTTLWTNTSWYTGGYEGVGGVFERDGHIFLNAIVTDNHAGIESNTSAYPINWTAGVCLNITNVTANFNTGGNVTFLIDINGVNSGTDRIMQRTTDSSTAIKNMYANGVNLAVCIEANDTSISVWENGSYVHPSQWTGYTADYDISDIHGGRKIEFEYGIGATAPTNASINSTIFTRSTKLFSNLSFFSGNIQETANPTKWNVTPAMAEGSYYIRIKGTDLVSNGTYADYKNFNIEIIRPSVTLVYPTNYLNTTQTSLSFNYSVKEPNLDTCELWHNISGTFSLNQSVRTNPLNFTINNLPDTTFKWNIRCNNTNGYSNWSAKNYTLTIDTTLPSVTLVYPTNYLNTTQTSLSFNYSVKEPNLDTCELWHNISGTFTLNQSIKTNPTNFTINNLPDTTFKWNIRCNDSANNVNWSAKNYTLTIDTTKPEVYLNSPSNKTYYYLETIENIDINYSVKDVAGINTIWYSINYTSNITLNGNLSNFTKKFSIGNSTIILCANDSQGNERCNTTTFRTVVVYATIFKNKNYLFEGETSTITLYVNSSESVMPNVTAELTWNTINRSQGSKTSISNNSTRFVNNFTVEEKTGTEAGNLTTYIYKWNIPSYSLNGSLNGSQVIYDIYVDDCTRNGTMILNFTVKDEETRSSTGLTNVSIKTDVFLILPSNRSKIWNFSDINNVNSTLNQSIPSLTICIAPNILNNSNLTLETVTQYEADLHVVEYHYLKNYIQQKDGFQEISLYDLKSADSTSFLMTYKDDTYLPVGDAIIDVWRYYVGTGQYLSVEHGLTNDQGETRLHLVTEDIIYIFKVRKNGVLLYTSPEYLALCKATPCQINLQATQEGIVHQDFEKVENLEYSISLNKDSRIVTLAYSTDDGSSANMKMNITLSNAYMNNTVCSETESSSAGTLTCTIPTSYENTTYKVEVWKGTTFVAYRNFDLQTNPIDNFGYTSVIMTVLMFLTLSLMAVSNAVGVIIFGMLGLIFATMLQIFAGGSVLGIGSAIIWIIIAGVIIMIKIANRRHS